MSNMSYCRFENTYRDLEDCRIALQEVLEGVDENGNPAYQLSESELNYAQLLVSSCVEIWQMMKESAVIEDEDDPAPDFCDFLELANKNLGRN